MDLRCFDRLAEKHPGRTEWERKYVNSLGEVPRTWQGYACPRCGSDHVMLYGSKRVNYEEEMKGGKSELWETSIEMNVVYGIECMSCMNRAGG